ncbi:hypothetical protein [Cystobacter ferrugineus]|uniref:HEAT repeat domain-containing protein n=1 Tax=Cystobacter ferrugineus TaxID=83449 RepID=A0A1L9B0L9_9BACT|nr:hypothetical protein [Cystobacter ferrugineus]OJH35794.1 hypothetical protein BON30_37745 [Cystobacter ferrugineus]
MRPASLLLALVSSCLVSLSPAHAFPIAPETLWGLARSAELVVLAEVTSREPAPEPKREQTSDGLASGVSLPEEIARLRVLEVWKGPKLDEVAVRFEAEVLCPAPPSYTPGQRVIAFLMQDQGEWYTAGLSYGTRHAPDTSTEAAYRTAVREAVAAEDSDAGRIDWGLRAAAHPELRWDGLYGLATLSTPLTRAQQQRLARSFISAPSLDGTLTMTLELLATYPSARLDAVVASALEELLGGDDPESANVSEQGWVPQALDLFATRLGRPTAVRKRMSVAVAIRSEARKQKKFPNSKQISLEHARRMRREWRELKRELHLAPTPLPQRAAPEP